MIAVVIYSVVAIALVAIAGYSVMSFFEASRVVSKVSDNVSRMEMALNIVKANIKYVDGQPIVPYSELGSDGYSIIPSWMGIHDASPVGKKYLYCPVASVNSTSGTLNTVTDGDSTTYNVYTESSASTGNKTYVTGFNDSYLDSSLQDKGILALLVSPYETSSTMPACSDVTLSSSGNYVVDGGTVKVIQSGTVASQRNLLSATKALFYVSPSGTGDGSGRDANNRSTLGSALAFFAAYPTGITEISLADGSYTETMPTFDSNVHSLGETKLFLKGEGTGANVDLGSSDVEFPIDLQLEDVNISSDILMLAGAKLFIGGDVSLESITLKAANLYFDDSGDVDLTITGSTIFNSGIQISVGSKMISDAFTNMNTISITGTPGSGVANMGKLVLYHTDITYSGSGNGISLYNGAILSAGAGTLTASSATGVYDSSGGMVLGPSTFIVDAASGQCWSGSSSGHLFEYSSNVYGESSAPQAATYPTDWSVQSEVNPYLQSIAIGSANRSDWTCN